ncbi:MAG: hypothetical protein ABI905_03650 [Betaproteobacteria bacterium]
MLSQFVLNAYACPMQQAAHTEHIQGMKADCCDSDAASIAVLCHEHCKDSKASCADAFIADFTFIATIAIPLQSCVETAPSAPLEQDSQGVYRPPAFAILNCCFRI